MMKKKSAYFVGIKGVGMTALSIYFKEKGYTVKGSDTEAVFHTDKILSRFHIPVVRGFDKKNISKNYDLVVVTGAHGGIKNSEAQEAKEKGLKVVMHGQALGEEMKKYCGISISGTHGKTTTSALVASILTHAGCDPSYVVGTSDILDLTAPGHYGRGKYFIAEADEYITSPGFDSTPRFLWQHPEILVITNIEYDHPDAYSDVSEIENAFYKLTQNLKGEKILIGCCDNNSVLKVLKKYKGKILTYGFSKNAMYQVGSFKFEKGKTTFDITKSGAKVAQVSTYLTGKHNILNSLAASLVCRTVGLSWDEISENILKFKGSRRRFEFIREKGKFRFYDDYAHHPTEIAATVSGARMFFPDFYITVIFQPHTYSRTKSLFKQFLTSFDWADKILIAPIYASAREEKDTSVSSEMLVAALVKNGKNAYLVNRPTDAVKGIKNNEVKKELIITMGAGDINTWQDEIYKGGQVT